MATRRATLLVSRLARPYSRLASTLVPSPAPPADGEISVWRSLLKPGTIEYNSLQSLAQARGRPEYPGGLGMALYLYNTMTRSKEAFAPPDAPRVGMYTCGPTVYNYQHIGNMRMYMFEDVLKRTLLLNGYDVTHVLNITDVGHLTSDADEGEDKMELGAQRTGKTPAEIARFYTDAFLQDWDRLNCLRPTVISPATEHIPEMIALIECLAQQGVAYEISDGVYFDVAQFAPYGALSRLSLEG